jgi:hypothetical protein
VPFIDITVRSTQCLDDESPVFYMEYAGVNDGFLCNGGTTVSLEEEGSDCVPVKGFDSVKTTKFYGLHICGKRGGKSFNEVLRPDIISKSCPESTVACSQTTSL